MRIDSNDSDSDGKQGNKTLATKDQTNRNLKPKSFQQISSGNLGKETRPLHTHQKTCQQFHFPSMASLRTCLLVQEEAPQEEIKIKSYINPTLINEEIDTIS